MFRHPTILKKKQYVSQLLASLVMISAHSHQAWIAFIGSCYPISCINENEDWRSISGIRQPFMSWMQKDSVRNNPEYFAFHENRSIDQENQGAFINKKKKKKGLLSAGVVAAWFMTWLVSNIACLRNYFFSDSSSSWTIS
jgi:hypothetical protein